jgi:hypothetical protein
VLPFYIKSGIDYAGPGLLITIPGHAQNLVVRTRDGEPQPLQLWTLVQPLDFGAGFFIQNPETGLVITLSDGPGSPVIAAPKQPDSPNNPPFNQFWGFAAYLLTGLWVIWNNYYQCAVAVEERPQRGGYSGSPLIGVQTKWWWPNESQHWGLIYAASGEAIEPNNFPTPPLDEDPG